MQSDQESSHYHQSVMARYLELLSGLNLLVLIIFDQYQCYSNSTGNNILQTKSYDYRKRQHTLDIVCFLSTGQHFLENQAQTTKERRMLCC